MNLDDLIQEYGATIRRVAASYAPPGAARDDLEQEIATAIIRAAPAFRGEAAVSTYVYRIAHNCGIDALKKRQDNTVEFIDERHRAASHNPEDSTLDKERRERLAAAIRQLPLSIRQPLVLRLEGLSYKEIAEVLDLTTSNVGVRIHRAKKALKVQLRGAK